MHIDKRSLYLDGDHSQWGPDSQFFYPGHPSTLKCASQDGSFIPATVEHESISSGLTAALRLVVRIPLPAGNILLKNVRQDHLLQSLLLVLLLPAFHGCRNNGPQQLTRMRGEGT